MFLPTEDDFENMWHLEPRAWDVASWTSNQRGPCHAPLINPNMIGQNV